MSQSFAKYAGCGNDFIVIDNRTGSGDGLLNPSIIARLCHRSLGIGADGIVLLENSDKCDYRMRIFNADGSEAEMCGNGVRCLARFIEDIGHSKKPFTLQTMHQSLEVSYHESLIAIKLPKVTDTKFFIEITINNKNLTFHYLDTGVPHVVMHVDDIESAVHMEIAPKIRYHPLFQPRGTNVNFAKINGDHTIDVRTYERGVEGETLACGTGAVAVALASARTHKLPSPITIRTRSKECLQIFFDDGLIMTGPAVKIFEGRFC